MKQLLAIVVFNIGVDVLGFPKFFVHEILSKPVNASRYFGNNKRKLEIKQYYEN